MKDWFDGWVTDRFPDEDGDYLVTVVNDIHRSNVCVASFIGGHWGTETRVDRTHVTAWAGLPEPYSESKHFLKEAEEESKAFADGLEAGLNEKMKKKAPLRCRIPAKLVGVSPSAAFTGCALGQWTPEKDCDGCPYQMSLIRKEILDTDETLKAIERLGEAMKEDAT